MTVSAFSTGRPGTTNHNATARPPKRPAADRLLSAIRFGRRSTARSINCRSRTPEKTNTPPGPISANAIRENMSAINPRTNRSKIVNGALRRVTGLTMRLSDAGLRCRQTKLIYPNHRSPPWLTEDAPRDRSNRLLDDTQRSRDRAHRSCHSSHRSQHRRPRAPAYRFVQFYGNPRFRGNADPDCEFNVDLERSADSAQPLRKTKWS